MTIRSFGRHLVPALLAAVATSSIASAATPGPAPTPARIAYPGGRDRSFGVAGTAAPPADVAVVWEAVAVQPDGGIVVVGNEGFGSDVIVARYDATGALDGDFGTGGIVRSFLPFGGHARAVALANDGAIVAVGEAYHDPAVDTSSDPFIVRLDPTGLLDRTFGADGVVVFDIGENGAASATILPADGGIVVLAQTGHMDGSSAAVVLGLRENGRLDPLFGDAGIARVTGSLASSEVGGMVAEPNGRFVVAVTSFSIASGTERLQLMRFDRNGHLARAFEEVPGFAAGIARLANGEIVVHGAASSADLSVSAFPALLHFTFSGALDRNFGDDGILSSIESRPGRIVVDGRNRVVVVADVLTRHFDDGALDTGFGVDGVAVDSRTSAYRDVALQPDGKIVAAGGGCFSNPKTGFGCLMSLARYESDRTQLCGDADASGTFTVTDGVAALRTAAGFADGCDPLVCDVDGSGGVTVTDGVNVLRAAAGLPATLHCGTL